MNLNLISIKSLWDRSLRDTLNAKLDDKIVTVLSKQTFDSIRRIQIFKDYRKKAMKAEDENLAYSHTTNPFILCQRESISLNSRVWFIYLATYFGKSKKSKWILFLRASYSNDKSLIKLEEILANRKNYYNYLSNMNFFEGANYSNHRKFTKKSIEGEGGVKESMDYFLNNYESFVMHDSTDFDTIYKRSILIPNFGRMAAFDFTSNLSKCNLNIKEPASMYHQNSTGPLSGLKKILQLAKCNYQSKSKQIEFGNKLLSWFLRNSEIEYVAQVLEDALCNWQKQPSDYRRYFG